MKNFLALFFLILFFSFEFAHQCIHDDISFKPWTKRVGREQQKKILTKSETNMASNIRIFFDYHLLSSDNRACFYINTLIKIGNPGTFVYCNKTLNIIDDCYYLCKNRKMIRKKKSQILNNNFFFLGQGGKFFFFGKKKKNNIYTILF